MERVRELSGTFVSLVVRRRVISEELLPEEHSRGEARTTGKVSGNIYLERPTRYNVAIYVYTVYVTFL